jgi:hypothetical protein
MVVYWIERQVQRLDRALSRKFLHHDSGIKGEIVGKTSKKIAELSNETEPEYEHLTDIAEKGYLEIDSYDEKLVNEFRSEFEELIYDSSFAETDEQDGQVLQRRLISSNIDFNEKLPSFQKFITPELLERLESYTGSYMQPVNFKVFRYEGVENEAKVYQQGWHLDSFTPDHLRILIFLSDDPDGDTPTQLLDRSQTVEAMKKFSLDELHEKPELGLEEFNTKQFYGEKGSAAILPVQYNLHRGVRPDKGETRDMLAITFAPSTKPCPDDWNEKPEIYQRSISKLKGIPRLFTV